MGKDIVQFAYADRSFNIRNKRRIQAFVRSIFEKEGKPSCRLQYVFCSDAYLLQINKEYLQHDDYTDIITFDLSADPLQVIEGEIYISVDRVQENAMELGLPFEQEMLRVIFHGALHLCGYTDKTKRSKAEMRKKEDEYLLAFSKGD